MTGEISGQVTSRNSRQEPAPSIVAASYRSVGTLRSAAMLMMIALPMPHRAMRPREGSTHVWLDSQSGTSMPTTPSNRLNQPAVSLR